MNEYEEQIQDTVDILMWNSKIECCAANILMSFTYFNQIHYNDIVDHINKVFDEFKSGYDDPELPGIINAIKRCIKKYKYILKYVKESNTYSLKQINK